MSAHRRASVAAGFTAAALALTVAGCVSTPGPAPDAARQAVVERTAHGVAHVRAPDFETLGVGIAYAHAQDNVCQTAEQLVTARGERSRWFGGGTAAGLLGRRRLPNEQIDLFVAAHVDDEALERAWRGVGDDALALVRGYVDGYNRFLADHAGRLPAPCAGQPWLRPMTMADYRRLIEIPTVQAGIAAFADAMLAAEPPSAPRAAAPDAGLDRAAGVDLALDLDLDAVARLDGDAPLGSNAWAFGARTTAGGRGLLLGNPHFPWVGTNRFWQLHATIPGRLDVMGVVHGNSPLVTIGFNRDVAWSHTVSTGRRFTLHELALAPGEPTAYVVDGVREPMTARDVAIAVREADGRLVERRRRVWSSRFGPIVVVPRAGLAWTAARAYALRDANAGNVRGLDTWLGIARARRVDDVRAALANLGTPWVNTVAADRDGRVLYADASVVPDVDAAHLARCAPSPAAAALRQAAGLVVLDGSRADCDWRRDPASPVPGLTPVARLPAAIRDDWVQNSNDSFVHTNPALRFDAAISPLVGDARVERPRTRASLAEIAALVARGPVTAEAVQQALFADRNFVGGVVVPDLLAACAAAPPDDARARDGCAALAGWDRRSDVDSRGAHLFREFWGAARAIPGAHRVASDAARPVETPAGLAMDRADVAAKVWDALAQAVARVRAAGFALDARLGDVQRPLRPDAPIALHGGEDFEGVLNNVGNQSGPGIGPRGLRIDYGTSYVQTVTFDARGPVAQAILTYGQSSDPASPHATDQMRLFSRKVWPALPYHADDVARERVGAPLVLAR